MVSCAYNYLSKRNLIKGFIKLFKYFYFNCHCFEQICFKIQVSIISKSECIFHGILQNKVCLHLQVCDVKHVGSHGFNILSDLDNL
jgi:hypothetical protein